MEPSLYKHVSQDQMAPHQDPIEMVSSFPTHLINTQGQDYSKTLESTSSSKVTKPVLQGQQGNCVALVGNHVLEC